MKPKISIIVPIYNVERYINRCINSILNQTFTNFELILVNDGSLDRCGEICNKYEKKDSRIKVIHKSNGGVSSARNIGIDNASGEYIGFVDPDDYIDENMYEVLYKTIKNSNSDIAISSFSYIINGNEKPQDISNNKIIFNKDEAIKNYFDMIYPFNCSFMWNKIFKKELFDGVRLNTSILVQEDTEIMIRLYSKSKRVVYIGQPLYFYELRDGSVTSNTISKAKITTEKAFLEIYNYTTENLSQFNSKALLNYISYYFNIIIEIIKNYDEYERDYYILKDKLKINYKEVLIDKKIPIKYKFHSSLILFSPKLYKYYIEKKLEFKIVRKRDIEKL